MMLNLTVWSYANQQTNPIQIKETNQFYKTYENILESDTNFSASQSGKNLWNVQVDNNFYFDIIENRTLILNTKLFKLSANKTSFDMISLPSKMLMRDLKNVDGSGKLLDQLINLDQGQYKLVYIATTPLSDGTKAIGHKELFFRVTNNGVFEEWNRSFQNIAPLNKMDAISSNLCEESSIQNGNNVPQAWNVALRGNYSTYARNNQIVPIPHAGVEIWIQTCDNAWVLKGTSVTDKSGNFVASLPIVGGTKQWKARLLFGNSAASVQDKFGLEYGAEIFFKDVPIGGDIGKQVVPRNTFAQLASWAYLDIQNIRNVLSSISLPTEKAVVMFDPSSEYETGFIQSHNHVAIQSRYLYSPNILIHELAHFYMYNKYGKWFSVTYCSTDIGRQMIATSAECSFIEGVADFLSLVANGNSMYNTQSHSMYEDLFNLSYNVEHTSSYANLGDRSPIKVAGALWDLFDKTSDGKDNIDVPLTHILQVLFSTKIKNLADFWTQWKKSGFSISARDAFHQNGIMYDELQELTPNTTQSILNVSEKTFFVKGTGQFAHLESFNYSKNTAYHVELYTDASLTSKMATMYHPAAKSFNQIKNVFLEKGKTYYVRIAHEKAGSLLNSKLNVRLLNAPEYSAIRPGENVTVQGEQDKVFELQGFGEKSILQTSYAIKTVDTILELYTDPQLKNRVAYDDDSYGKGYSKISNYFLNNKQIYYLKVKNKYNNELVYAKVTYKTIKDINIIVDSRNK